MISRPLGQRHRLGGVDCAPHVFAGDLAVLAGDGDDAAAVDAVHVGARQAEVDRVDLDAGGQLGLLERLLDRLDGGLEVHDHAAPDAPRVGAAHPDDVERPVVARLADDRGHLRGADVEADDVSLLTAHHALILSPVSIPRDAGDAARRPPTNPSPARRRRRPHEHPRVVTQIDVIDGRDPLAQRRRQIELRLQPLGELLAAEVHARRIVVEHHHRVLIVRDVNLGQLPAQLAPPADAAHDLRRQPGAHVVDEQPGARRPDVEPVDDRQLVVGVAGV